MNPWPERLVQLTALALIAQVTPIVPLLHCWSGASVTLVIQPFSTSYEYWLSLVNSGLPVRAR